MADNIFADSFSRPPRVMVRLLTLLALALLVPEIQSFLISTPTSTTIPTRLSATIPESDPKHVENILFVECGRCNTYNRISKAQSSLTNAVVPPQDLVPMLMDKMPRRQQVSRLGV